MLQTIDEGTSLHFPHECLRVISGEREQENTEESQPVSLKFKYWSTEWSFPLQR
jgi:hypothetical protein